MADERITGKLLTECPTCEGIGYTTNTAPTTQKQSDGKLVTLKLGSGCEKCLGTGQLVSVAQR